LARRAEQKHYLDADGYTLLNKFINLFAEEFTLKKSEIFHQLMPESKDKISFMPTKEIIGIAESSFFRLRDSKKGLTLNLIEKLHERLLIFGKNSEHTPSESLVEILKSTKIVGSNSKEDIDLENLPDGIGLHQICFKVNIFIQIQDCLKNIQSIKSQIFEHIKRKGDIGDSYFKATFNPNLVEKTFRIHLNVLENWLERFSKLINIPKKNLEAFVKSLEPPTISEEYALIKQDKKKLKAIYGLLLSDLYFQKLIETSYNIESYIEEFYFMGVNINNIKPENPIYSEFATGFELIYKSFIEEKPISNIIKILKTQKKSFSTPYFEKIPQELISNNHKNEIKKTIDTNIKTIEDDILISLDSFLLSTELFD